MNWASRGGIFSRMFNFLFSSSPGFSYLQLLVTFIPFCLSNFFYYYYYFLTLILISYLLALIDYIWGFRSLPFNQSTHLWLLCP